MGRGKAIVIICFLENSSVIKGLNGAHTMGTSYLFREVWLRMLLSYVFFLPYLSAQWLCILVAYVISCVQVDALNKR